MKILLTGFEPFGGEEINPSWMTVKLIADTQPSADIFPLLLPVEYYKSVDVAINAVNDFAPDIILSVGQAGGRTCVNFENVAVNIADSDTPDNAGVILHTVNRINGPDRLYSTLPLAEMAEAINKKGFPVKISQNAGRFVCNHVFYGILNYISDHKLDIKAGFAHVPYIPSQTVKMPDRPSMSLENITECINAALSVLK
ncbi:MAG: pyroglutamyl-peptidase I [Clostridia bacterium]|nr:pyroglutamyl-peptidase I [Clostridia bacterium]